MCLTVPLLLTGRMALLKCLILTQLSLRRPKESLQLRVGVGSTMSAATPPYMSGPTTSLTLLSLLSEPTHVHWMLSASPHSALKGSKLHSPKDVAPEGQAMSWPKDLLDVGLPLF